ncbi:MAG: hypothetical protein HY236_08405, partial [Acidobacteria bacterium]|nr:hypothetical protein [Acidobacteriota bacterium]
DGWFLIPFFALYFLLAGSRRVAMLFLAVASLGHLYWLGHNYYSYNDALEFYRGPHSARAIYERALAKGLGRYPGDHDFRTAWLYYRRALETALGRPVAWMALGTVLALLRKATRPLPLLALPILFYVISLHSGGTPIFIPSLYPYSFYNTRYALAALPACAAGAGLLVGLWPKEFLRVALATAILALGLGGWVLHPTPQAWVCWKESEANSRGRRTWTREATELYEGNGVEWQLAVTRPDLYLHERWVVALAGDEISFNLSNPRRYASVCDRVAAFSAEQEPVIEVYRKKR